MQKISAASTAHLSTKCKLSLFMGDVRRIPVGHFVGFSPTVKVSSAFTISTLPEFRFVPVLSYQILQKTFFFYTTTICLSSVPLRSSPDLNRPHRPHSLTLSGLLLFEPLNKGKELQQGQVTHKPDYCPELRFWRKNVGAPCRCCFKGQHGKKKKEARRRRVQASLEKHKVTPALV